MVENRTVKTSLSAILGDGIKQLLDSAGGVTVTPAEEDRMVRLHGIEPTLVRARTRGYWRQGKCKQGDDCPYING